MNLFNETTEKENLPLPPLSFRMRPQDFSEFVGQEHIVGENTVLTKAIKKGEIPSLVFWGPPGCGKTTLAEIIACMTKFHFEKFSAVTSNVSDIRRVISSAKERLKIQGQKTILFVDEIHRFNKAQQDGFLPYVEDGTIILIGATTENPYFEINSSLLSRVKIYKLNPLTKEEILKIIYFTLQDEKRGLKKYNVKIDDNALSFIAEISSGDARIALSSIEISALSIPPDKNGKRIITLEVAKDTLQKATTVYDKNGDAHYDTISAYIKSMRGSDPDASLYWLARMLYGGEDPKFIARRLIICASEDVGNADPLALLIATSCFLAVDFIGMPEAQIPLAQATVYIASAPKSNAAYLGIKKAMEDVENLERKPVPLHLRDASYKGAKNLGHQKDYQYPHDFPGHFVEQNYVPENIKGRTYYEPTDIGYEAKIKERMRKRKK